MPQDLTNEQIHITKKQVMQYSGYLYKILTNILGICVCMCIFIAIYMYANSILLKVIGALFAGLALWQFIRLIQNIVIAAKIKTGKYEILVSPVHSLKFRNPYAMSMYKDRVLALNTVRITVDPLTASRFSIGDTAVVVFAEKVHYPIVIKNLKDLPKDENFASSIC
jgi:hypothetical protein